MNKIKKLILFMAMALSCTGAWPMSKGTSLTDIINFLKANKPRTLVTPAGQAQLTKLVNMYNSLPSENVKDLANRQIINFFRQAGLSGYDIKKLSSMVKIPVSLEEANRMLREIKAAGRDIAADGRDIAAAEKALKKDIEDLKAELAKRPTQVDFDKAAADLAAANAQIPTLQGDIAARDANITKLEADINNYKTTGAASAKEIADLTAELNKAKADQTKDQAEIKRLEKDLADAQKKYDELKKKFTPQQQIDLIIEEINKFADVIDAELVKPNFDVADLDKAKIEAITDQAALDALKAQLAGKEAAIDATITKITNTINDQTAKYNALQAHAIGTQAADFAKAIKRLTDQRDELNIRLKTAQDATPIIDELKVHLEAGNLLEDLKKNTEYKKLEAFWGKGTALGNYSQVVDPAKEQAIDKATDPEKVELTAMVNEFRTEKIKELTNKLLAGYRKSLKETKDKWTKLAQKLDVASFENIVNSIKTRLGYLETDLNNMDQFIAKRFKPVSKDYDDFVKDLTASIQMFTQIDQDIKAELQKLKTVHGQVPTAPDLATLNNLETQMKAAQTAAQGEKQKGDTEFKKFEDGAEGLADAKEKQDAKKLIEDKLKALHDAATTSDAEITAVIPTIEAAIEKRRKELGGKKEEVTDVAVNLAGNSLTFTIGTTKFTAKAYDKSPYLISTAFAQEINKLDPTKFKDVLTKAGTTIAQQTRDSDPDPAIKRKNFGIVLSNMLGVPMLIAKKKPADYANAIPNIKTLVQPIIDEYKAQGAEGPTLEGIEDKFK